MIKTARERIILISPFLKLNDRIKELLEDKNRLKIDIRIVYGKNELQNDEINWLKELTYIRTSFCKNLHAKCYINEDSCIITSLNLYEFSQVNNNEMGIFVARADDAELYMDAYEEAQRIIRISDEVRISLEKVSSSDHHTPVPETNNSGRVTKKLTTSKLATKLGVKTDELNLALTTKGYLENKEGKLFITELGKSIGGEVRPGKFGAYFLWPEDLVIDN